MELQQLQTGITALTESRVTKVLARLQNKPHDVLPFREHAVRNRLFAKFETLIQELIETKPFLTDQLCSVCEKYEWIIPPGADDLRINKMRENNVLEEYSNLTEDGFAFGSNLEKWFADSSESDPENVPAQPVWLAEVLPSGSLFQLLTRPACRICMLVLHLLSPLPIKSLLSWALDQPLPILHGYLYSMHYQLGEEILVKVKQPRSDVWQDAGTLEMMSETKSESGEQSLIWESGKLSRKRFLNSSWIRTTEIDYELVKYWLRQCNEYHEHCHIDRSQGQKNLKIRLIDVVDQCVVHGTLANRYFALSYVWGGIERLKATKDNISALEEKDALRLRSASIPRTVQDAMTFVARLGQRYLWVDSLCIVQDHGTEKHDQITVMHEIYSAAYATIVQHSGCDANAGLPGIRTGSRSLISTKTHVGDAIMMAKATYSIPGVLSSSIHSTRGWTLQEVLLSTRCLHFFNKHLTFVCGEKWAQDWNGQYSNKEEPSRMGLLGSQVSSRMLWRMNPFLLTRVLDGPKWNTKTLDWLQYFEIYGRVLTDYTTRQFSYESDILHAFHGLGGAITRLNGTRFHFGLPSNAFDLALLWINIGLGERRKSKKQHQIPTWSWAAWTGQSTYNLCNLSGDPSEPYRVNSYVRRFYVIENNQSVEIARHQLADGRPSDTDRCTPYFEARQAASEPPTDLRKTAGWPEGCLHFWAEECTTDQLHFYIRPTSPSTLFLHDGSSNTKCGVLALPSGFQKSETNSLDNYSSEDYSLILVSESPQVLHHWKFGAKGTLTEENKIFYYSHDSDYYDGTRYRNAWMFNVLFVKRVGAFVERVAFGQVHMLAWLQLKRRRRYIRII